MASLVQSNSALSLSLAVCESQSECPDCTRASGHQKTPDDSVLTVVDSFSVLRCTVPGSIYYVVRINIQYLIKLILLLRMRFIL